MFYFKVDFYTALALGDHTQRAQESVQATGVIPGVSKSEFCVIATIASCLCVCACTMHQKLAKCRPCVFTCTDECMSPACFTHTSDIWLKQKSKDSIMIFRKVKAKVKWFMKVKGREKSIDLVKSQRKVQWKMSKLLSMCLALWWKLWKTKS